MGVDARISLKFSVDPSPARVKELQYHLMHRFGQEMFRTKTLGDRTQWERSEFIEPITRGEYYFDSDQDMTGYWEVSVWCRYYGEGYERGPGLELAGILYFLALQPDISEVWYGGDSSGTSGTKFDKLTAIGLFEKYIRDGRFPYTGYFDRADKRDPSETRPNCSYCELPMNRNGFGGKYAAFYCEGCGESLTVEGDEYRKWINGEPFEGKRVTNIVA